MFLGCALLGWSAVRSGLDEVDVEVEAGVEAGVEAETEAKMRLRRECIAQCGD